MQTGLTKRIVVWESEGLPIKKSKSPIIANKSLSQKLKGYNSK